MGILDLPAPLFGAIEAAVADYVPPLWRLALWAAFGAWVSIELYKLLSPQQRIAAAMQDLRSAQRALDAHEGEFRDAFPLMGRMMRAAGRRLMLVAPATIAASLPVLALIVWLDTSYGARFPDAGESVAVRTPSAEVQARWEGAGPAPDGKNAGGQVVVEDPARQAVVRAPVQAPVSTIHKWEWWNTLIGNPAGYLPKEAPVDRVEIELPRVEVLNMGPSWARTWELPFFVLLVAFAFLTRWARRVV